MSWKINDAALAEACEALDLTFPAQVRVVDDGPAGMAGKYHGLLRRGPTAEEVLAEPVHHISLSGRLATKMVSEVLWHEMTHAKQCERFLPVEASDEEPHVVANRGLQVTYRAEMRGVRQKHGGSKHHLTMDYQDVSFEEEACENMKRAKDHPLVDAIKDPKKSRWGVNEDPALLDSEGRATWRVDVFKKGQWNLGLRRHMDEFVKTIYVVAVESWNAKQWARDQIRTIPSKDLTAHAYQVWPLKKEVNNNGNKKR